jgi:hypothetical protein
MNLAVHGTTHSEALRRFLEIGIQVAPYVLLERPARNPSDVTGRL